MTARHRLHRSARMTRGAVGRLSWGLADQAVSSMTNFAVGAYVARSLGLAEFGIFTLAWVSYGLVLNVSRGLATDPLVVRFSAVPVAVWRSAAERSCGTALAIGTGSGIVSALVGIALGGSAGTAFVGLGLVLPGLLLQDSWRFAFFAAGRGKRAFLNDLVRAAALIPALAVAVNYHSVFAFVLAWGSAGAVAAACGAWQGRLAPRAVTTLAWVRRQHDLSFRYVLENLTNSGVAQLRMYGIGAIAGLAAVGTIRGAEILLGPFLALLMGLSLVAVPEAARVLRDMPYRLRRFCVLLGGGQACAALAWGVMLLVLVPDTAGVFVLGSVWSSASVLIAPATLSVAGAGLVAGATTGLRALGAARRSLRAQVVASVGYLAGGLVGAAVAGAAGAAWGSAIGMWLGAIFWWGELHRESRALPTDPPPRATTRYEGVTP